jgi:predicted RNase H-like nuclease (RuvC/YqgF family)
MPKPWFTLLVFVLGMGGCRFKNADTTADQQPDEPTTKPGQVARLQATTRILDDRAEELRQRSSRLAEQVRQLKFLNTQLRKQLEAVGDAPRERDALGEQVARQKTEIDRLQQRIQELEQRLAVSSSGPSTRPAQSEPQGQ